LLCSLLNELERAGLIAAEGADETMPTSWTATAAAARAREQGQLCRTVAERHVYSFLENESSPRRVLFANLNEDCWDALVPIPPPSGDSDLFDLSAIEECIGQTPAWKQRRGFPANIQAILSLRDDNPAPGRGPRSTPQRVELWQRVAVDRLERLFVVLSREVGTLHAFAVRPQGWLLHAARPCFSLADGDWEDFFTGLASAPSLDSWRQAWLSWGQSRQLPVGEVETCSLECEGTCLRAIVGRKLMGRLRSTRGGPPQGENWLLAGTGTLRACARLEIVPA
jgi:hypothetical protein